MADEEVSTDDQCRHCGAAKSVALDVKTQKPHETVAGDWQCAECERWQDTMSCPACGQPVSRSLMAEREKGA